MFYFFSGRVGPPGDLVCFVLVRRCAHVAQSVEHILGKDEVTGSIPVVGSTSLSGNKPAIVGRLGKK